MEKIERVPGFVNLTHFEEVSLRPFQVINNGKSLWKMIPGRGVIAVRDFLVDNFNLMEGFPDGFFIEKRFLNIKVDPYGSALIPYKEKDYYSFPKSSENTIKKIPGVFEMSTNFFIDKDKSYVYIEDKLNVASIKEVNWSILSDDIPIYFVSGAGGTLFCPCFYYDKEVLHRWRSFEYTKVSNLTEFVLKN